MSPRAGFSEWHDSQSAIDEKCVVDGLRMRISMDIDSLFKGRRFALRIGRGSSSACRHESERGVGSVPRWLQATRGEQGRITAGYSRSVVTRTLATPRTWPRLSEMGTRPSEGSGPTTP